MAAAAALTLLPKTLLLLTWSTTMVSGTQSCKTLDSSLFVEDPTSLLYSRPSGRLGNRLTSYMIQFQLREMMGVRRSFMPRSDWEALARVFDADSLQVEPFEDHFCRQENATLELFRGQVRDLLLDRQYRTRRALWLFPNKNDYRGDLQSSYEHNALVRRAAIGVRRHLRFHPRLAATAEARLRECRRKFAIRKGLEESGLERSLVYVGIHNRRTDFQKYTDRNFYGVMDLEEEYFQDAMRHFRAMFARVVFIFVSDDMKWARLNVENTHKDVFFASNGDLEDPGPDLALLAACNHTIITRGSFSIFSGILAGGIIYSEDGPDNFLSRNWAEEESPEGLEAIRGLIRVGALDQQQEDRLQEERAREERTWARYRVPVYKVEL